MMMLKKKCPTCGHLNDPDNMLCDNCGAFLTPDALISIDEDVFSASSNVPQDISYTTGKQEDTSRTVFRTSKLSNVHRRCSACGSVHPYNVQTCECGAPMAAGEIVTDDEVTDESYREIKGSKESILQEESYSSDYVLRSEDGQTELTIHPGDELTLGRGYEFAPYLAEKLFVSTRHAIISLLEGRLRIMHIGNTNPTLVNGKRIEREKLYPLRDGDMIALGAQEGQAHVPKAAYFRVKSMK